MKRNLLILMTKFVAVLSPRIYIRLSYFKNRGRLPNLKRPSNLSEIILSTIDSGKVKIYSDYVDKLKVRDVLIHWGYSNNLTKIYGVWECQEDIDYDDLPSSFALKTNHGCGHHYICKKKSDLDILKAKKVIGSAMAKDFGSVESQYKGIVPKVYCEEYLDDGTGELPVDYKFMCTNGVVKCVLVVAQRTERSYKLLAYDSDWNKLDYIVSSYQTGSEIKKPQNFNYMLGNL